MNAVLRSIAAAAVPSGGDLFVAGARAFLADAGGRYAKVWKLVAVERDGGIDGDVVLGNVWAMTRSALAVLEPTGDPERLVFEALRELVLFYLFQAGERLPRDADEAVTRSVKQKAEAVEALL